MIDKLPMYGRIHNNLLHGWLFILREGINRSLFNTAMIC